MDDKKELLAQFKKFEETDNMLILSITGTTAKLKMAVGEKTIANLPLNEIYVSQHAKKWKKEEIGDLINMLRIKSLIMPAGRELNYADLLELFPLLLNNAPNIHGFYGDYKRLLIFLFKKSPKISLAQMLTVQTYIVLARPYKTDAEFLKCELNNQGAAIPVFTDSEECGLFLMSKEYKNLVEKNNETTEYVPMIAKYKNIRTGKNAHDSLFINPASVSIKDKSVSIFLSDALLRKAEGKV